MIDPLNPSRHVSDVKNPVKDISVIERKVTAQETATPDFQASTQKYAEATNSLSAIGATVAQSASNQMAAQLGYEEGKNPHGTLTPSITEFDKNFAESYHTQAQSTLGLAGDKLLSDAQVTLSKANRLTPQLIDKTHNELRTGLQRISEQAPLEVKGKLEQAFSSQLLHQTNQYREKMIGQQREDQANNIKNGIDLNIKNATELAMSGDYKASAKARDTAIAIAQSGHSGRYITPETARVSKETAEQAYYNGLWSHQAKLAYEQNRLPVFMKEYGSDLHGMTNEQHMAAGQAITQQVSFMQGLRSQYESLESQKMLNRIALVGADKITDTEWTTFAGSVSPQKAAQVQFHYIQALKNQKQDNVATDALINNYSDPTVQANATEKIKNDAFNKKVNYAIENSHKTNIPMRSPAPIGRDEAEVMVASQAGAEIPVFTNSLKNKLKSSNPNNVLSAMQQIHALQLNGNGQALNGLNEQDWSMFSAAQSLLDSPDPVKAAQDAHNRIYNQDPEIEKMNKQKWSNILTKQNSSGISNDQFALKTFNMDKDDFINPTLASAYGANILSKLGNFFSISGNYEEAVQSTKRWVDANYGDTFINGGKFKTIHPIEQKVGFINRDGTPYIQQNIIEQFNAKFAAVKAAYNKKNAEGKYESNEYWETLPVNIPAYENPAETLRKHAVSPYLSHIPMPEVEEGLGGKAVSALTHRTRTGEGNEEISAKPSGQHGIFFKTYDPIKVQRHTRTPGGEKVDTFNVVLIGNTFGDYDIAIQSKSGMRNLYKEAPFLGVMTVKPESRKIMDAYNKDHKLR